MQGVTTDNWNFTYYESKHFQCFISLIGMDTDTGPEVHYALTLSDLEGQELQQEIFTQLSEAVGQINNRYGHLEFHDKSRPSSSGGCDTCQAH